MSVFDVKNAGFNPNLTKVETSDPVSADFMNGILGQLINNDVAIMEAASSMFSSKNDQALFLLNLHKDGKKYGVHFDDFDTNHASAGTRLNDAAGMVAYPSTDTERKQNDFEGVSVFYHIEVNGYVDSDGNFQVQYIDGIDDEFSRTESDVWCLYLTQWISITIDAYGENKILSDTKFDGSFPEGGAIMPDGTIRKFVAIPKYQDSAASGSKMNSVSGKIPSYNNSYNSLVTKAHLNGTQYCATSFQDLERMNNLFDVAFATRNSQSVMAGCTGYYVQYTATVTETGVERIVISNSNASNLVVGSTVSIGDTTTDDRNVAATYGIANRVKITKIETYDDSNKAVYVDNGGTTFNVTSGTTRITTYPWYTGACDGVLASCGSPNNNTNGKNPYLLFGVEFSLGQYEVVGNAFMNIVDDSTENAYVCYDSTNLAVSPNSSTTGYTKVGYNVARTGAQWKYISKLGYDPDNPMARWGIEVNATSSNGYADAQYTDAATSGQREILALGFLHDGAPAGRRFAYLNLGLGYAAWHYGARLSASGRSAQAAA